MGKYSTDLTAPSMLLGLANQCGGACSPILEREKRCMAFFKPVRPAFLGSARALEAPVLPSSSTWSMQPPALAGALHAPRMPIGIRLQDAQVARAATGRARQCNQLTVSSRLMLWLSQRGQRRCRYCLDQPVQYRLSSSARTVACSTRSQQRRQRLRLEPRRCHVLILDESVGTRSQPWGGS